MIATQHWVQVDAGPQRYAAAPAAAPPPWPLVHATTRHTASASARRAALLLLRRRDLPPGVARLHVHACMSLRKELVERLQGRSEGTARWLAQEINCRLRVMQGRCLNQFKHLEFPVFIFHPLSQMG